ncbi:hypothetical protein FRB90_000628 [Tulasnella sp. 427]|nr:hypothetical protein FRB90_000628 [Tulasnella sp. 427]
MDVQSIAGPSQESVWELCNDDGLFDPKKEYKLNLDAEDAVETDSLQFYGTLLLQATVPLFQIIKAQDKEMVPNDSLKGITDGIEDIETHLLSDDKVRIRSRYNAMLQLLSWAANFLEDLGAHKNESHQAWAVQRGLILSTIVYRVAGRCQKYIEVPLVTSVLWTRRENIKIRPSLETNPPRKPDFYLLMGPTIGSFPEVKKKGAKSANSDHPSDSKPEEGADSTTNSKPETSKISEQKKPAESRRKRRKSKAKAKADSKPNEGTVSEPTLSPKWIAINKNRTDLANAFLQIGHGYKDLEIAEELERKAWLSECKATTRGKNLGCCAETVPILG